MYKKIIITTAKAIKCCYLQEHFLWSFSSAAVSWEGRGSTTRARGTGTETGVHCCCRASVRLRHLCLSWSPGLEGLGRHDHLQRLMAHRGGGGGGGGAAWGVCRGLCGGGSGGRINVGVSSLIAHGVCVSGAASSGLTHCRCSLFHPSECG